MSQINVLRARASHEGRNGMAVALRTPARSPEEDVTMMWVTVGGAVLLYAYFKVRRRRLARNN
jgi:hypothetical protein